MQRQDEGMIPPAENYAAWPVGYQTAAGTDADPDSDEQLPAPRQTIRLPIGEIPAADNVQLSISQDRISLTAREAPIDVVLAMIAEQHGLNIVTGDAVTDRISIKVTNVRLDDALDAILAVNGFTWSRQNDIIIVSKVEGDQKASPATQGRQLRVFDLNFVAATDIDKVVKGLLSPVGQSFINQMNSTDHRRTHEQLVVEDIPIYLRRVEQYLRQADCQPKQVMIEAHVLQVTLKNNCRHGVNLEALLHHVNPVATLSTVGMAATTPATSFLKIDGTYLNGLIEAIQATTDSKTLASPKVAVLNGQEAHMQVGGKIGYLLTTTTQTSTLQSVNFLDIGVILTVTPSITDDGQILMLVKPQVSTGRINATTNLPESETTEVSTRVMLGDGEALVIGGLIKETDIDNQVKLPFLGDLWLLGWLFQKREITRERNEIIITLVPRIIPDAPGCRAYEPRELQRSLTPLLYGPLRPVNRMAVEPKFYDYHVPPKARQDYLAPLPGSPMVIPPLPQQVPPLSDNELRSAPSPAPPAPPLPQSQGERQSPRYFEEPSTEVRATNFEQGLETAERFPTSQPSHGDTYWR